MKCRFEIVGLSGIDSVPMHLKVNGKSKYRRLLIKKVKEEDIKEPNDVALLMQYNKKFLIIGNGNAVTYKEIFPLIKENKMWLGAGKGMGGKAVEFMVEESIYDASKGSVNRIENGICYVGVMMVTWFTNLDHFKRHEEIDLYKHYNAEEYPKYDNYDAIEVSRVTEIPMDYEGVMGVPISFLDKYCPTQFEIKGLDRYVEDNPRYGHRFHINGKETYARILIKKVKEEDIKEPNDVALLMQYNKKFLIIGNMNAITYKEIFPLIKDNQLWAGYKPFGGGMDMIQTEDTFDETKTKSYKINDKGEIIKNIMGCIWFTNLTHSKRTEPIDLYKHYNEEEYPKYDNYDAIEVGRVSDIPMDYDGVIGVPITFLGQYCPTQFEIIDAREVALNNKQKNKKTYLIKDADGAINGKPTYARICIKRISK